MKLFLAVCLVLASAMAISAGESNIYKKYLQYRKDFNKTDNDILDAYRFLAFSKNVRKIEEHNKKFEEGQVTYTIGLNKFSDWTEEEIKRFLATSLPAPLKDHGDFEFNETLASEVDWRKKGVVNPVQNQEQCGSCWAFSSIASTEGVYALATGNLVKLSEQNLVDCDTQSNGCEGGRIDTPLDYIIKNGISSEADYPYTAQDGTCQGVKKSVASLKDKIVKTQTDEDTIAKLVAKGPVTIAVHADSFMGYTGGIYDDPSCKDGPVDHGMTIVGYTEEAWIVRNSWGPTWGEEGYIRFKRGVNTCNIVYWIAQPIA